MPSVDNHKNTENKHNGLVGLLIDALLDQRDPSDASCILTGPVYEGSHSIVFRGEGSLFPFPVAIKQCFSPEGASHSAIEAARIQYDALERVYTALGDESGSKTPRAVSLIEREGIIISEWVEGAPLNKILNNPETTIAEIERGMIAAGEWLATFHASQQERPRPLDLQYAQRLVEDAVNSTSKRYQTIFSFAANRTLLDSTGPKISNINVPVSWTHGDFKPHNILIHNGRAVGLDIGANFQNSVLYDIAHFLNHLEIGLYHPKSFRLLRHRDRLIQLFRSAYGGLDEYALPEAWLRFLTAVRLRADHWVTARGKSRIFNDILFALLIRRLSRTLRGNVSPS